LGAWVFLPFFFLPFFVFFLSLGPARTDSVQAVPISRQAGPAEMRKRGQLQHEHEGIDQHETANLEF